MNSSEQLHCTRSSPCSTQPATRLGAVLLAIVLVSQPADAALIAARQTSCAARAISGVSLFQESALAARLSGAFRASTNRPPAIQVARSASSLVGLSYESFEGPPLWGDDVPATWLEQVRQALKDIDPRLAQLVPDFAGAVYALLMPSFAMIDVSGSEPPRLFLDELLKDRPKQSSPEAWLLLHALLLAPESARYQLRKTSTLPADLTEEIALFAEVDRLFWSKLSDKQRQELLALAKRLDEQEGPGRKDRAYPSLERLARFSVLPDEPATWRALAEELRKYPRFKRERFDLKRFNRLRAKLKSFIEIPQASPGVKASAKAKLAAAPPVPGRTVMVAHEERHLVKLAQVNLERAGYTVIPVYYGEEMLDKLRQEQAEGRSVDLIIARLYLEGVGSEWINWPEVKGIPKILLTARAMGNDLIRGWLSEPDSYLTLPFNPAELLAFAKRMAPLPTETAASATAPEAGPPLQDLEKLLRDVYPGALIERNAASNASRVTCEWPTLEFHVKRIALFPAQKDPVIALEDVVKHLRQALQEFNNFSQWGLYSTAEAKVKRLEATLKEWQAARAALQGATKRKNARATLTRAA